MIPPRIINAAMAAASESPCAKSKRGVVIFDPRSAIGSIYGAGNNHQPEPFVCTGDEHCRRWCAQLCNHAEQVAIVNAMARYRPPMHQLQLVHVKVRDGLLVADPDDVPSCWQCSRLILEVGIAGVWLYQNEGGEFSWRYYTAVEFHRETLINCDLPHNTRNP